MKQGLLLGFVLGVAVVLPTAGRAQPATADVAAQREAMAKLGFWAGEWKGTGWYQAGPGKRYETSITEKITPKLGGLALLAEGLGRTKDAEKGTEITTHDAMAIICYDDATKKYRFVHYRAGEKLEEAELKLTADGVQWERKMPRGTARFTAKIADGRWHEVGEFSPDGKQWFQFMEMTLQRQGSAAKP